MVGQGKISPMFTTTIFSIIDVENGELDKWLNSFRMPGYGARIASMVVIPTSRDYSDRVSVTIVAWKLGENPAAAKVSTTIDQIPEEPSINYPDDKDEE